MLLWTMCITCGGPGFTGVRGLDADTPLVKFEPSMIPESGGR